jgi:hypothetical protein
VLGRVVNVAPEHDCARSRRHRAVGSRPGDARRGDGAGARCRSVSWRRLATADGAIVAFSGDVDSCVAAVAELCWRPGARDQRYRHRGRRARQGSSVAAAIGISATRSCGPTSWREGYRQNGRPRYLQTEQHRDLAALARAEGSPPCSQCERRRRGRLAARSQAAHSTACAIRCSRPDGQARCSALARARIERRQPASPCPRPGCGWDRGRPRRRGSCAEEPSARSVRELAYVIRGHRPRGAREVWCAPRAAERDAIVRAVRRGLRPS